MDRHWWHEYGSSIRTRAEFWTTNREAARIYRLNLIGGEPGGGITKRPGFIRLGGNSGYQAVALAVHFGATRIVLLGYDMQNAGKRTHWHGDHKRLGNPIVAKFPGWLEHFGRLAGDLPRGVKVINSSRETALRCFKRQPLDESLAEPAALRSGAVESVHAGT